MKILSPTLCFAAFVAISGCAGPASTDVPAASGSTADSSPVAVAAPQNSDSANVAADGAMPAMTAEQHAAMDAAATAHAANHDGGMQGKDMDMKGMDMKEMKGMDMKGMAGVQAGWYRSGTLQACGSTASMKVSNTAELEKQIKAGGMQSGDPVYVRLEGSMAGTAFNVTRVAQVGSPTPVRDCAMTGVVTQSR